ncbi:hypothetical protein Ahy_B10g104627 isoform B [Arachis hypogaea]|uniref:Myb/SANT-like domain-containing protein n=1 Tax=Arachis hypogaea TaxID=3818 RepID=A0A444X6B4_ARAHY|nr:hypothetical protein Ahy_B10g104627 isoform B [Arachis hypogaea]
MGSQVASTNDRSRMHWTPSMERYFIDVMLEHVQRGNRVGYTFNKHAWSDMLARFNAKFGSQCDKDVLKSRYSSLWKQFHDVKNILCHAGFSWDAARQMVVADDVSWDEYLETQTDARCYRTKPVLNFDDLCVIYSHTSADGRYSLSSHDACVNSEVQRGDGMGSNAVLNSGLRTDWSASMDQYFIELLLDQLSRGNIINHQFSKKAWTDMLDMFKAKFGSHFCKRILKNRLKKLLKYYCDITNLLKQGFLWDDQQRMIAADESVWDAYVKVYYRGRFGCDRGWGEEEYELIYINVSDDEISNLHQEQSHDVTSGKKAGELQLRGEGKGCRNPSGSDRTRTYWTPPMDQCLIDLLLKQVKSGNRLGQTFITQAWNDMITSFNAQFKSQCDKEVLKNRYKHLRKQFNDVNNLLQQSGFSWDDKREIVAAQDHVWHAYIKVHPEARSLRVKTLPGYRKLCVIFGEECSGTRYIQLSRNADPSCEMPMSIAGEQKNSTLHGVCGAASTIDWTESKECCFIDLMIEQVNRRNMIGNLFNEQAWTHMTEAFCAKFGHQYDKQFLVDQYLCLMKLHDDIGDLLSHGGFAWDETLQIIVAENDTWDAYIKDHPDAISYRNRILYLYNDLRKVFGNIASDARVSSQEQLHLMDANDIAIEMDMDGNLVVSDNTEILSQDRRVSNDEMDMVGISGNLNVTSNNGISNQDTERPREMDINGRSGDLVVTGKRNKMDTNGSCRKPQHVKKRPRAKAMDSRPPKKNMRVKEALSEMASAVKSLMNNKERNDYNSPLENALSELQAMPDIDDELVMDACDLLEDERMAKIFLALDISLRKKWLLRKLRQ